MEMDNPRPVRFRVVLELTFPDADPWNPSDYDKPLEQMKTALESAPNVNCKEVMIREATTIGDDDNYEVCMTSPVSARIQGIFSAQGFTQYLPWTRRTWAESGKCCQKRKLAS